MRRRMMPPTYQRPPDAVDPLEAEFSDDLTERVFQERLINFARNRGDERPYHTVSENRGNQLDA
jgi:acyl dehydratase